MPDTKSAMALELRQIIQVDRLANDIIQRAEDTRKSIEKQTKEEVAKIYSEAQNRQDELMAQVQGEQAQDVAARKNEASRNHEETCNNLDAKVEQNRAAWVEEITGRITKY